MMIPVKEIEVDAALSLSRGSFYGRWKKRKKKKSLDIAVALCLHDSPSSPLRQRITRLFTGDTSYASRERSD
jgi:hypothetical protein